MPRSLFALAVVTVVASASAGPPVAAVAWSPDGKRLAIGAGPGVSLVGPDGTGAPDMVKAGGRVTALAFAPGGTLAVAAGEPGKVGTVTLTGRGGAATPRPFGFDAHKDSVLALAWSPDGRTLATASYDRTVKLWRVTGGPGPGPELVKSADGPSAALAHTLTDHSDSVYAVAFHPSGKLLATGGADRAVKVWDAATGRRLYTLADATDWVYAVAWTPDGSRLVTGGVDKSVRIYTADAAGGKLVAAAVAHEKPVLRLFAAPDSARLVSVGEDRVVKAWDLAKLAERAVSPPRPDAVLSAALSPDGATLALGRHDGATELLDAATAEPRPAARPLKPAGPVPEPAAGVALTLPATVAGGLSRAGEVDTFALDLLAGQEVGARLTATLAADKFAPVLAAVGPDGRVIAEASGPRLGFTAPAAGRYALTVRDRQFRGGPGHTYSLRVGPVPVVAGAFPLAVPRGRETAVSLAGVNLGPSRVVRVTVPADAAVGSRVRLPLPEPLAGELGAVEVGVCDRPGVPVPPGGAAVLLDHAAAAEGVLRREEQADRVRFRAVKGRKLVVEVEAARLGSPLDPTLVITDAKGEPVPRAVLRPVAKLFTTFRDNDPTVPGIRLEAWPDLRVDDYLFADGELMRVKSLPPGPDDDCQFVQAAGKRVGHLGTTPAGHANGTALYKVEVHPPGRTFPPNGMPVVTLPYRNDDAVGRDPKIVFDPPADGEYVAVVADAAGAGGPAHGYRLVVRPPAPDFAIAVAPGKPAVWAGGGVPLAVTATRLDEFDGPIDVTFENLPAGFACPPTRVEAGQLTAAVPLTAAADAKPGTAPVRVVGRATIGGRVVTHAVELAAPAVRTGGDLTVTTGLSEVRIRPGGEARLTVEVARHNGHAGRVPVALAGLPHGVRVLNVGLNGVLITPDRTTREVVLAAEPWVKPGLTPFVVQARSERKGTEHAAPAVVLRVE